MSLNLIVYSNEYSSISCHNSMPEVIVNYWKELKLPASKKKKKPARAVIPLLKKATKEGKTEKQTKVQIWEIIHYEKLTVATLVI